jgi:proteasome lid subunit RPN8/RPN11
MGDEGGARDVRQIDLDAVGTADFPAGLARDFRVVVAAEAVAAIDRHAATDTSVELAGVLVGRLLRDASGPFLLVDRAVEAAATRRTTSRVTFTHDTWEHIHEEIEATCPDLAIVGWYHTHPGFGVFLSEMDRFIQENFFNLPHQVALVVDPLSGERGLFVWRQGRSERLRRFWLGGELCYDLRAGDDRPDERTTSGDEDGEGGAVVTPPPATLAASSGSFPWLLVVVAATLVAFWAGAQLGGSRAERNLAGNAELQGLLLKGALRQGLESDLTRVAEQIEAAYVELGSGDRDRVGEVRASLGSAHRELVRIRRVHAEGERLLDRLRQQLAPPATPTLVPAPPGAAAEGG